MTESRILSELIRSPTPRRDKFLARLLGIVAEEIVHAWCRSPHAPYENLGRPRLSARDGLVASTLDFTLRRRSDGKVFVAELKCWTEYQNYRYLPLREPSQLRQKFGPAFDLFLSFARSPDDFHLTVNGTLTPVDGAVLIWSEVTDAGKQAVREHYEFADVLSVSDMVSDLLRWPDDQYQEWLRRYSAWSDELWMGLGLGRGKSPPPAEQKDEPSFAELIEWSKALQSQRPGTSAPGSSLLGGDEAPRDWVRLLGVVAGFQESYGAWPNAVRLPFASLEVLASTESTRAKFEQLQRQLDLIVDETTYAATGKCGRSFSLAADLEPSDDAMHS